MADFSKVMRSKLMNLLSGSILLSYFMIIHLVYSQDPASFCDVMGGEFYPATNSCFKVYVEKKNWNDSVQACQQAVSEQPGWRGRLAVLITAAAFNFLRVKLCSQLDAWIGMKTAVAGGSTTAADWSWVDGAEQFGHQPYCCYMVLDKKSTPDPTCAFFRLSSLRYLDESCSAENSRICEFLFEEGTNSSVSVSTSSSKNDLAMTCDPLVDVVGSQSLMINNTPSLLICLSKCKQVSGCNLVTYDSETRECLMPAPSLFNPAEISVKSKTEPGSKMTCTLQDYEQKDQECQLNPCSNGSLCVGGVGHRDCICRCGTYGPNCDRGKEYFCNTIGGSFYPLTNSCFKVNPELLTWYDSVEACKTPVLNTPGWRGRLAVLSRIDPFYFVKPLVCNLLLYVALKTDAPSTDKADWKWLDDGKVASVYRSYVTLHLDRASNPDPTCARFTYGAHYEDVSCTTPKYASLCEFVFDDSTC